jgi:serine/threonine protein kinase
VPRAISTLLAREGKERALGPFVLVRQLGSGGFAPVWLAKEMYGGTELRMAALKLFALAKQNAPGASAQRQRVIEEARALCRVEHPNIVRFYALPTDEPLGIIALAMELVDGPTLSAALREHGKLTVEETLNVGIAVASALAAVHRSGLLHRDVKPANVVEQAGTFKLIDFGIAAAEHRERGQPRTSDARSGEGASRNEKTVVLDDLPLEAAQSSLSTLADGPGGPGVYHPDDLGTLTGTPGYIDPERMASPGRPTTAAGDLYAFGALLYECLSGMLPAVAGARADGIAGLKGEVLDGRAKAPPVAGLEPGLPPALSRLVDRLVEPRAADRPASAQDVARDLESIRGELHGRRRVLPPEDAGPFRGFGRFEEGDRDVFFGRRGEVAAVLETLRTRGVVALVGGVGSGKSSLARAGVGPAVCDGDLALWPSEWDVVTLVPGRNPDDALAAALNPYLGGAVPTGDALGEALANRVHSAGRGLLLLVDQLEELVTLGRAGDSTLARLVARIGERPVPGLRALVTVRQDVLKDILAVPRLGQVVVGGAFLVTPLAEGAWAEVLDQAILSYGYSYEDPALREEILRSCRDTSSAMTLAQFGLLRLWEKRDRRKRQLTRLAYTAMGGIKGALERHADKTVASISAKGSPDSRKAIERLLLSLTTSYGSRALRSMDDLDPAERGMIDALLESHLVVRVGGGVTLAHDSLISSWTLLRGLVVVARDDRLAAEEMERTSSRWLADPDPALLWRRRQLAAAEDLARRGHVALSDGARLFLKASRGAERRGTFARFGTALAMLGLGAIGGIYEVARAGASVASAELAVRNAHDDTTSARRERDEANARLGTVEQERDKARESARTAGVEVERLEAAIDAGACCAHAPRWASAAPNATPAASSPLMTGAPPPHAHGKESADPVDGILQ